MHKVVVMSQARTQDTQSYACLKESCERLGAPLHMWGMDVPMNYPSNDPRLFTDTIEEGLRVVSELDTEYILASDAFDVICVRWDEKEIEQIVKDSKVDLVVSTEANCFPNGPWKDTYDMDSIIPWRYGNQGQFVGTKPAMLQFLETLKSRFRNGDYSLLHKLYCEGYPFKLDRDCRIFQSMYTEHVGHVKMEDAQVRNSLTCSSPMFLHFNGRAPGMSDWYRQTSGLEYPVSSLRPEYV